MGCSQERSCRKKKALGWQGAVDVESCRPVRWDFCVFVRGCGVVCFTCLFSIICFCGDASFRSEMDR